jgi:hypothetical protein
MLGIAALLGPWAAHLVCGSSSFHYLAAAHLIGTPPRERPTNATGPSHPAPAPVTKPAHLFGRSGMGKSIFLVTEQIKNYFFWKSEIDKFAGFAVIARRMSLRPLPLWERACWRQSRMMMGEGSRQTQAPRRAKRRRSSERLCVWRPLIRPRFARAPSPTRGEGRKLCAAFVTAPLPQGVPQEERAHLHA